MCGTRPGHATFMSTVAAGSGTPLAVREGRIGEGGDALPRAEEVGAQAPAAASSVAARARGNQRGISSSSLWCP